jgi:hypothetical protein
MVFMALASLLIKAVSKILEYYLETIFNTSYSAGYQSASEFLVCLGLSAIRQLSKPRLGNFQIQGKRQLIRTALCFWDSTHTVFIFTALDRPGPTLSCPGPDR